MFRHFKWNLVAWLFLFLPRLMQGQEGVTNAFDDLERQGTVENEEYCEMRQVASSDEVEMLIQENPVTGYFCFTEDRMHDIRMTDAIPQRWIDRPAVLRTKLSGDCSPGEFYTWRVDWFASLAALTGSVLPKGAAPDSYNYLGTLLGTDNADRPWVIEQASDHTLSVRTKDWKYIETSNGPKIVPWGPKIETGYSKTPQLYDMTQVGEQENLAEKRPEVVYQLQEILKGVRNNTVKPK